MKLNRKPLFGIIGIVLGITVNAQATEVFHVTATPYLGYGFLGSTSASTSSVTTSIGTVYGVGIGGTIKGKVGDLIFGGLDLSYYPSLGYSPAAGSSGSATATHSLLRFGPIVGVELPAIPLSLYAGYNFVESFNLTHTTGSTAFTGTYNGSSFKVGAGYRLIPLLSINLEYFLSTYGSITTSGTTTSLGTGNSVNSNMFFLSCQVPFDLM